MQIRVALLVALVAMTIALRQAQEETVTADAGFGPLPEARLPLAEATYIAEASGWRASWELYANAFDPPVRWRLTLTDIRPPNIIVPWKRYGPSVEVYLTAYYCSRVPGWPLGDGGGYCGAMRNGEVVHWGAAACGDYWPLGTVLDIAGYGVVTCKDTGHLGWTQVDIFMPTNADVYSSGILSTYRVVREVLW